MIDAGCVCLSDAVTGAISLALVPVTRMSEPSAMPLSASGVGGDASAARAGWLHRAVARASADARAQARERLVEVVMSEIPKRPLPFEGSGRLRE